ncbi:hypothetical protein D3C87_1572140 [compost metagenome]
MNNIEISNNIKSIEDLDLFLASCSKALEKVSAQAPSDSLVKMGLDHDGEFFLVRIELISQELMMDLEAQAKTPFMALENALKASLDKVQKWSVSRKVHTA